jgi:DNA-binding transcriptional MerR regulator
MRIGELSKATGVSSRALRYYEQQGLLHSERRPNGYREYAPESVEVVAFVQDLFHAGLSSDVIRDILPCANDEHPSGDCAALLARVRQVRDELVRQEHHIAERRRRLDTYLAAEESPRSSGATGLITAVRPGARGERRPPA